MSDAALPSKPEPRPTSVAIEASVQGRSARWWAAVAIATLLFLPLSWLLARLIWLPFYFGLFFFLVAGLLVGAATFRIARPARPLSRSRLAAGVIIAALCGSVATILWEYRGFAAGVAAENRFAEAKNSAIRAGGKVDAIKAEAADEFRRILRTKHPPGGPLGYIRWAISSGKMDLEVRGSKEVIAIGHQGLRWLLRTGAEAVLLALGLWLSFESLRSPTPVSNILAPGEEAEELEE